MEIQLHSQTTLLSPFLSIWMKPRETFRRIVSTDPTKHVIPLAMLAGIGQALGRASAGTTGDSLPLIAILAQCIIFGSVGGIISLYIGNGTILIPLHDMCQPAVLHQP